MRPRSAPRSNACELSRFSIPARRMPEECARDCWVMRSCGADGPKLTLAKTHNLIRSSDWQGLHNPGNTPTSNYPGMDATRRTHRNQCSLHRQNSLICGSMWCQLSSAITHDSRRNGELKGAVSLGSSMATGLRDSSCVCLGERAGLRKLHRPRSLGFSLRGGMHGSELASDGPLISPLPRRISHHLAPLRLRVTRKPLGSGGRV